MDTVRGSERHWSRRQRGDGVALLKAYDAGLPKKTDRAPLALDMQRPPLHTAIYIAQPGNSCCTALRFWPISADAATQANDGFRCGSVSLSPEPPQKSAGN